MFKIFIYKIVFLKTEQFETLLSSELDDFSEEIFSKSISEAARDHQSPPPTRPRLLAHKRTPTSLSERLHKANKPPNRCHATPPCRPPPLASSRGSRYSREMCISHTGDVQRGCPAGVVPRGRRRAAGEVTSTHILLWHVTSSPLVALTLCYSDRFARRVQRFSLCPSSQITRTDQSFDV